MDFLGTYTVSVDTKKVLMIVEEPVIISAEEFSKLTPGYHVSAADSDPYFEYPELDVSENYDPADPTTMFDDYCLMFVPRESGSCMLEDSQGEYWQRLGINSRYVFLDLDPECEIDDYKTPTLVDTFTPFGFSDGPTTLARSMIYCDIIRNASKYAYDGWIGVAITVKPCYIENVVYRFFFCAFDKGAGVDDYRIRAVRIGGKPPPRFKRLPDPQLEIDRVLRAAERNESERASRLFHLSHTSITGFSTAGLSIGR